MTNNNIKEMLERIAYVAYTMGKDGVDKYEFSYKMDKILSEVANDVNVSAAPKSDVSPADMMDRIAADPDRFLRGLTIKDRYPRIADRERYTIIKVTPQDKDMGDERIDGVFFEDGKLIWMHGERFKGGKYVSGKEYREVEIPTWVRG